MSEFVCGCGASFDVRVRAPVFQWGNTGAMACMDSGCHPCLLLCSTQSLSLFISALTRQAGPSDSGRFSHLHLFSWPRCTGMIDPNATASSFEWGLENLNSDINACRTRALSTEPSPQSQTCYIR